jgi:hypothetical protein
MATRLDGREHCASTLQWEVGQIKEYVEGVDYAMWVAYTQEMHFAVNGCILVLIILVY